MNVLLHLLIKLWGRFNMSIGRSRKNKGRRKGVREANGFSLKYSMAPRKPLTSAEVKKIYEDIEKEKNTDIKF